MQAINLSRFTAVNLIAVLIPAYLVIAIYFISGYFKWDANAMMGVCMLPYICSIEKKKLSLRYLIPALCSIVLTAILPVNTLFFLSILFTVLLLIENSYGKVHSVLFFLLILISPLFKNITRLGEFPLRLWLTEKVAELLTLTGNTATAAGNLITLNIYEFAVDPACAGLNMLATSLIICLLLIAFYQRKTSVKLRFFSLNAILATTVLLNLACNFFRIMLLVYFKVMPGNVFHDLIGVGCLAIYVILPLVFAFKRLIKKHGTAKKEVIFAKMRQTPIALRHPTLHIAFFAAVAFLATRVTKADNLYHPAKNQVALTGYNRKDLDGGIIKLENHEALIYLKPTPFYAPEHDPMVCWTGSGYIFSNIKQEEIQHTVLYTAVLQKGKDKIYAAWWFDNGVLKTTNQLNWRWQALKGAKPFYLVNANAASPEKLKTITEWLLHQNHLINN